MRSGQVDDSLYEAFPIEDPAISILAYNMSVIREQPASWNTDRLPTLKSKLIFEEYRHGLHDRSRKENVLLVQDADGSTHRIVLPVASIGSLPSNDIVIDDPSVSRRHAVILNFQDDVWVYDLESTFGTFVDGMQVNGRTFLDGVHELKIGNTPIRVTAREGLLL
jgi:pSer/pThr/pTyr-binding forkhead associated (FHA) protein